jgi:hypothetical protein
MSLDEYNSTLYDEYNIDLIPYNEYTNDNNERIITIGYGNKINLDKLDYELKYIINSFNLKMAFKWNEFIVIELGLRICYIYKHTTNTIIRNELVKYKKNIEQLVDVYVKKRNFFYDKYFNNINIRHKFICPETNKLILNVVPRLERYSNYCGDAFELPIVKLLFKLRSTQREIEDLFNLYYESVNDKINYYDGVSGTLDFYINQYNHDFNIAALIVVNDYYKSILVGYKRDKCKLAEEYYDLFDCDFII